MVKTTTVTRPMTTERLFFSAVTLAIVSSSTSPMSAMRMTPRAAPKYPP
jgi:hypothetical protein